MNFNIVIDFKDIYKDLSKTMRKDMWDEVASKIYARVIRLINEGRNVDGAKKAPYSAKYRTWKTANRYGATVNLQLTSNMVQSISFRASNKGFEIYINGAENNKKMIKWNSHKNWKSFEWGTELEKELDKAIETYLKKTGLI